MNITAKVQFVSKDKSIITFSHESDTATATIQDWDEWGTITLGDTLYDFHCLVDDSTVGVYVYGLTDADKDGIRSIDYKQEYICDMVGDFINDARVWAEFNDYVDVEQHNDVTKSFHGKIVRFKENRTIVSVKDMEYNVWDCDIKYVTIVR